MPNPIRGSSTGIRQSAEQAAEAIAKKGSAPDRELDASVKSSGTTPPSPGGKRKNAVLKLLSSVPLFRGLTSGERATIARELVTKEANAAFCRSQWQHLGHGLAELSSAASGPIASPLDHQ